MKIIEKTTNKVDRLDISNFEESGVHLLTDESGFKEYHFVNIIQGFTVYLGLYDDLKPLFDQPEPFRDNFDIIESSGQLSENFVLELVKIITK